MAGKEGDFGGLPSTLFGEVLLFLNGQIATGGGTGSLAATALAMLAEEEHSAANPIDGLPIVEVVFRLLGLDRSFRRLQAAGSGSGNLTTELGNFTSDLTKLRDYWATGK
jgi:hypothetical protein